MNNPYQGPGVSFSDNLSEGYGAGPELGLREATGSDLPNLRILLDSSTEKAGFKGLNRLFQPRIGTYKQTKNPIHAFYRVLCCVG